LILLRVRRTLLFFFALVIGVTSGAFAEDEQTQDNIARYNWFLTAYSGIHAQEDIGDVFALRAKFEDNAYIGVVALARQFWHYEKYISLEAEGQIGKHFNTDDQWEFVGLIAARWHEFPWNNYVTTSVAVGEGISYYTEISNREAAVTKTIGPAAKRSASQTIDQELQLMETPARDLRAGNLF
jgi:hypothetical protein